MYAAILKRDFSDKRREHLADTGAAMPDGSFPIVNGSDLKNAIALCGNAKDSEAAKAHIRQRAKDLGLEGDLPDDWKAKKANPYRADQGKFGTRGQHQHREFKKALFGQRAVDLSSKDDLTVAEVPKKNPQQAPKRRIEGLRE